MQPKTGILNVCLGNTGWTPVCELAPEKVKHLIHKYSPDLLTHFGYETIAFPPGLATETMLKTIYEKHGDLKEGYDKILALGGDHTVSFPIVKAFLDNQPLTYLYFDAHLDYYKDSSECYNWNVVEKIRSSSVEVINVGFRDFLDCIKTRAKPRADVEIGHRSTSIALLADISLATQSTIHWDPKREQIKGNPEASDLLHYEYRKPWKLD